MTRRTLLNDPCEARNEDREPTPLRSGLALGAVDAATAEEGFWARHG